MGAVKVKEAAKRSAASLFDYFLRHNDVGGFKLFLLHFILQIVSAYTQNSHKAEPQKRQKAKGAWQFRTDSWLKCRRELQIAWVEKRLAFWVQSVAKYSQCVYHLHPPAPLPHLICASWYLRICALRIYGVIKRISFYLSVGPKLFVTLYASLNDIRWVLCGWGCCGQLCGRDTFRYLSISLPQLWLMASVSLAA